MGRARGEEGGRIMSRWASVLFWSILAAAFIGPGTVTTAATAGVRFGPALLWALVFSTAACFVLQEASARLRVVSGRSLGAAIRQQYPSGVSGALALALVLGAVVLGCAAYEAGNILGGVAGASLVLPLPPKLLTVLSVLLAAFLLWFNSPRRVAMGLGLLVATMGVAFLWTAILLRPDPGALLRGALVPWLAEMSSNSISYAVASVGCLFGIQHADIRILVFHRFENREVLIYRYTGGFVERFGALGYQSDPHERRHHEVFHGMYLARRQLAGDAEFGRFPHTGGKIVRINLAHLEDFEKTGVHGTRLPIHENLYRIEGKLRQVLSLIRVQSSNGWLQVNVTERDVP